MKILCISDHIDPVIYSQRIRKRFRDVDFILSCGDLRLNYYDFIITNLNKPLFFVFGNHHIKNLHVYKNQNLSNLYYYENKKIKFQSVGATYIDGKCEKYKDLLIMGFDGCMWYNGGENQFTELAMTLKVLKTIPCLLWNKIVHKRYLDILVTHAPPYEIHDQKDLCHRGFKIFRWFLKRFKPRVHLHGHIHLYNKNANRIDKFGETDVINAFDHYILEI